MTTTLRGNEQSAEQLISTNVRHLWTCQAENWKVDTTSYFTSPNSLSFCPESAHFDFFQKDQKLLQWWSASNYIFKHT